MIEWLSTIASIERLNAIASLITLANVVALSGLIFKLTREWKEAREAQYKSELTGKDRMIEQAEARHKSEIAEKEWVIKQAEVQHKNELAEKDRTIDQLREKTYEDAGQEETLLRNMISYRNDDLKKLRVELNKTRLGDAEKAELLENMKLQFDSEQRVLKAVLDIGSEDSSIRLAAARELRKLRDRRTIPRLIQTMSEEFVPTMTKITVMRALREYGKDAVPPLIDQLREHARLVSETSDLSEEEDDPHFQAWRGAILDSDAGRLLINIGEDSIPQLQTLRNHQGLLGEAADALLTAIESGNGVKDA